MATWDECVAEERAGQRLPAALLGSLFIHLFLLTAMPYGKLGADVGSGLHLQPVTRLEVSFSVAATNPPLQPDGEISVPPCTECSESQPQAATPLPEAGASAMPHYWPLNLLDKRPRPLYDIDLNTPELDAVAEDGKVELTALVDAEGHVDDVEISRVAMASDPPLLRRLLAERFRNARFSPGEVKGRAVATAIPITVVIEPR